jgi:hypothetical protein
MVAIETIQPQSWSHVTMRLVMSPIADIRCATVFAGEGRRAQ